MTLRKIGDFGTGPLSKPAIETVEAFAPQDRLPARLSREHYDVLRLLAEGREYLEIAAIIGVPLGTVRSRINRGRTALAKLSAPDPQINVGDKITTSDGLPPHGGKIAAIVKSDANV